MGMGMGMRRWVGFDDEERERSEEGRGKGIMECFGCFGCFGCTYGNRASIWGIFMKHLYGSIRYFFFGNRSWFFCFHFGFTNSIYVYYGEPLASDLEMDG